MSSYVIEPETSCIGYLPRHGQQGSYTAVRLLCWAGKIDFVRFVPTHVLVPIGIGIEGVQP